MSTFYVRARRSKSMGIYTNQVSAAPMSMNALRDAILLNNAGVRFLQCGDLEYSLHSFQRAISSVKLSSTIASEEKPLKLCNEEVSNDSLGSCQYHHEEEPMCNTMHQLDGLKNDISFIYNRPLLITTEVSIQSAEQLNSLMLSTSTYIVFNFALACHVCGKLCGKEEYLTRASRFYQLTLKVLASAEAACCSLNQDSMHPMLQCVTLNNLAQLRYEQCDYKTCQIYIHAMHVHFLMNAECLNAFLDAEEIEEIMLV
jgi:hypothetical protein